MSKFTTQRNFGFGKQMDWAGHQALKDIYGRGHFGTVASHAQRWRQFCHWARSIHGINDACAIDQSLLESYAADLAERVEDETLAVSYAQNLIVSANITLEAMRQDKTIRIESPASYVGKRQTVRTKIPDGMDWSEIDRLVACLRAEKSAPGSRHRPAMPQFRDTTPRGDSRQPARLATSGQGTRADRYSGRYQGRPRQGSRTLGAGQRTWPACPSRGCPGQKSVGRAEPAQA
jgi:hypothetical protein